MLGLVFSHAPQLGDKIRCHGDLQSLKAMYFDERKLDQWFG